MEDTVDGGGGNPTDNSTAAATTTMSVTVKTLDSQNHDFTVPEDMLVKDFKVEITEKVKIPADQQRLIFRGRVLQDEKKMGECNVASNTIHVVQRPANSSRSNDEPPPVSAAGGRMPDGMQGGLIIAAQTGPLPNFGPRCSASSRIQASNHMLARASTFLRRIEELESVSRRRDGGGNVQQDPIPPQLPIMPAAAAAAPLPPPTTNNNNNNTAGNDMEVDEDDEADWEEESGNFHNMITQMATAATVASLAGIGGNNSPTPTINTTSNIPRTASIPTAPGPFALGGNRNPTTMTTNSSSSRPGSGSRTPTNTSSTPSTPARRTESPRLEEMATVIEGIISVNERLTPYLRYIQNALRTNRQYTNVEEQRSVQYLFDTMSSIMHYMSHSYHALSDMICDFSSPATTRRLRAATAVVLETSTMLRASIPIAVPVGFVGMNPQQGQPTQQPPAAATAQPQTATPPLMTPAVATPPTNAAGNNQQNQQSNNIVQAVGAQIAQMFAAQQQQGGGQGGGQVGGSLGGGQFNLGNLGHGNFEAQIHVGIDDGGVGGAGGGGMINIQDLAQMLGGGGGGGMMQQGHWQGPTPQQQQQQGGQTPSAQQQIMTGAMPSSIRNNNNTSGQQQAAANGGGVGGRPSNNSIRLQQGGPFDILVPCNSHHGWRTQPGPRPPNFLQHVNVVQAGERGASSVSSQQQQQGQGFFATALSVLLQSNLLTTLQPAFQDVIVNYLMRGRDAKNKDHVKSCAKKLSRNIAPFFETFTNQISARDMNVDYTETFASIITEFLTQVFHLTVTLPSSSGSEPYQYHSAVVNAGDKLARQILIIFRYCFKEVTGNGFEEFAEYIVDTLFAGCSILLQDEIRRTVADYFKRHDNNAPHAFDNRPSIIQIKKDLKQASNSALGGPSTPSSSSSSATTRPVTSLSKSSPDVVPPKQAKQSHAPVPMVGEDDLDDFLDLQASSAGAVGGGRSNPAATPTPLGGFGPPNMEAAIRNIPSEWVEAVRHDMHLQFGMPEQPPFSQAYTGIFSKKSM